MGDRQTLKLRGTIAVHRASRGDAKFDEYPELSIEEWHRRRGLWID